MLCDLYVQVELAKMLLDLNQAHLFEHWPEPGVDDDGKRAFFEQVVLWLLYLRLY